MQSQLRQLLLKLARPRGMNADERSLLAAADAFYGVSDLALATDQLTIRADNTALLSALGASTLPAACCLAKHEAWMMHNGSFLAVAWSECRLIVAAAGAAGCTSHVAAQKAATVKGVMRMSVAAADARAAVAQDLISSMVRLNAGTVTAHSCNGVWDLLIGGVEVACLLCRRHSPGSLALRWT